MDTETKNCPKCDTVKPITEFSPYKYSKHTKYSSWCKKCCNTYAATPRYKTVRSKRFKLRYKEDREFKKRHLANGLFAKYGITLQEYEKLFDKQHGVCALCGKPSHFKNRKLAVDHDHSCCKGCVKCIRGLLCDNCNYKHLPWLERNPLLQSNFVRRYLQNRPFLNLANNGVNCAIKTPAIVSN